MFLSLVVFTSIFFKIWWGVLFGTPNFTCLINNIYYKNVVKMLLFLIFFQFLLGIIPNILISSIGYIV